ncbi:hypothetical protein N7463_010471 [Penicillium fimorum]|uniref:Uncharacterized protein n=1 Tax=Penicillium fimorum TaxID=1882269 RepID=A0A9W9XK18_9EURO|nr:hypothetical protein N7463_010471 [Penicillium fimorum]
MQVSLDCWQPAQPGSGCSRELERSPMRHGEKGEEGVEEEKEHFAHFLPTGGHDKRTSGSRKMSVLCVV